MLDFYVVMRHRSVVSNAASLEGPEKRTSANHPMDRQKIFVLHKAVESGTETIYLSTVFSTGFNVQSQNNWLFRKTCETTYPLAKQPVVSRIETKPTLY